MQPILHQAHDAKYAIPQINVNGLIWIEGILRAAEKKRAPIILGTTDKIIDYLGGYEFICKLIHLKAQSLNITIPYVIHLDHGNSVESCIKAIDAGYDSVMYDGSRLPLEENIENMKKVVNYAHQHHVLVEGEIGGIGGNEDGLANEVQYADLDECKQFVQQTHLDALAPALGSVHGRYQGEPKLGFKEMTEINEQVAVPLVLHGASGLSDEDLKKAILLGHSKINFNTEINIAWSQYIRQRLNADVTLFNAKEIVAPSIHVIQSTVESIIDKCDAAERV